MRSRAWKFLAAGAIGRFSDAHWPEPSGAEPGDWVEAAGPLEQCRSGVHACETAELLDWLDDELWEVELAGASVSSDGLLVAERGRLVRRVESWDDRAARAFVADVRERAERERPGEPLVEDLRSLGAGWRPEQATDAVPPVPVAPAAIAANVGFVAAHAAGVSSGDGYDAAFAAERALQLEWLLTRLRLG